MDKKNLVIIAGSCYPICSATGKLALKCAEFLKDDYNVIIISVQEENNVAYGDIVNGCKIYTLSQWRLKWYQCSKLKYYNCTDIRKKFYYFSYNIARLIGRIHSLFFALDNCSWYSRRAEKLLEDINRNSRIDVIISFNQPIESHFAAEKFKLRHSSIKWIAYWADLFACNTFKLNILISLDKMRKIEKRLLVNADANIATQEVKYELDKMNVAEVVGVPYIMSSKIIEKSKFREIDIKKELHFIYMGSLYRSIRNPENMFKFFMKLPDNYILDLYSAGNCDDIVEKYILVSNGRIRNHGLISTEKLEKIMLESDVLVNIENTQIVCQPSKVFELLSYKKPIVIFNSNKQSFLTGYPLAYFVDDESSSEDFSNFLTSTNQMIDRDRYLTAFSNNTEDNMKKIIKRVIIAKE